MTITVESPAAHSAAAPVPARADGAIEPSEVRLFRGPCGVLRCTGANQKSVLRAKVVRAFPLTDREHWFNVLDWKNKEVCLIEHPDELDGQSRRLLFEEVDAHYRIAEIQRVHSLKNEYRTLFWDVETQFGRREFVMKWGSDTILWLEHDELMLIDVDTNRFHVANVAVLDARSQALLSILM